MTTSRLYSGKSTLALVTRASALTFDLLYGSTKLKYLKYSLVSDVHVLHFSESTDSHTNSKQTQTGFRAESFTSHSYGTSSILSFYKTPGKELFKMGMVKPPFLTRCIATGISEAPVPQNVSDAIPDVAPRIKFKRLDKQARHIMQILDKEAVQEVKENREIAKEIADIKPGYIIQLKVEVPENKRRISTLKGTVIARRNAGLHSTFRLRRQVAGVGVESVFPLYSPNIKELKILEKKKVRKAKLYYIRDRMNALKKQTSR